VASEVVLYQAPRLWGLPNPSPFCVKVELWLRLAGVPYTSRVGLPVRAPRGKVPWIEHEGQQIADSEEILRYLEGAFGDPLGEASRGPEERGRARLVRRTLEEGTYFLALYDRWVDDRHWPTTKAGFFERLPWPMRDILAYWVRRGARSRCDGQGVSRYSDAQRAEMAAADWAAVSAALGDGPYLLGDRASAADCTLYGFACQAMWAPYDTAMARSVRADPRLVAYAERIRNRAWPT
jgi:glutathione S-transferase